VAYLSNQVEAKIARANRAFRLSSRIICAARGELASHGEWLDRHATWAAEVKRHHRLLRRKLAKLALRRYVVGLLFAAPFALVRAIEAKLKRIATPASPPARVSTGAIAISPVGVVTLVLIAASGLIAAGAVHAMLSGPPAQAPAHSAPKAIESRALKPKAPESRAPESRALQPRALEPTASGPKPHAAASLAVEKTAEIERSAPLSGFAMLPAACSPDSPWLPPQTVSAMMSMTRPLAPEPMCPETAPASIAAEPLPPKQANPAKRKRSLAARDLEPLPWWQEWSWIKLR